VNALLPQMGSFVEVQIRIRAAASDRSPAAQRVLNLSETETALMNQGHPERWPWFD